MEIARLGNHYLSVCPYCDKLFDVVGKDPYDWEVLGQLQEDHMEASPDCKRQADALPSLQDAADACRPAFAEAEAKRQEAIDSHPDNGREGYWRVDGIRHDARTRASSAREAIEKCSEEVQSWESPEATFIGEELPTVF
jgi:hypothetical protein